MDVIPSRPLRPMSPVRRFRALRAATLITLLAVTLTACHALTGADDSRIPKTAPAITGLVTAATAGTIRVEENPGPSGQKLVVHLTGTTRVLRRNGTTIPPSDIVAGEVASVWFTGPMAESYPPQVTADVVVIGPGPQL